VTKISKPTRILGTPASHRASIFDSVSAFVCGVSCLYGCVRRTPRPPRCVSTGPVAVRL